MRYYTVPHKPPMSPERNLTHHHPQLTEGCISRQPCKNSGVCPPAEPLGVRDDVTSRSGLLAA